MGVDSKQENTGYSCELCVPRRISQEIVLERRQINAGTITMYRTLYFGADLYAIGDTVIANIGESVHEDIFRIVNVSCGLVRVCIVSINSPRIAAVDQ